MALSPLIDNQTTDKFVIMKLISKVLVTSAILVLMGCGCANSGQLKKAPTGNLIEFSYTEHNASMYPKAYYTIGTDASGNPVMTHVTQFGDTVNIPVKQDVMDKVKKILDDHKAYKFNTSYTTKLRILDGTTWSFSARYSTGESISSGGYMAWPKGNPFKEIKQLLQPFVAKATKAAPAGDISYYYYRMMGMVAQPLAFYELTTDDNGAVSLKTYDYSKHDYVTRKISPDVVKQITKIAAEHRMHTYDNSYKPKVQVLDGEQWNLTIKFASGEYINSNGHCAGPDDNGIELINEILNQQLR